MQQQQIKDFEEYCSKFSLDVQFILQAIRSTIKTAAPLAEETIKYGMPTFTFFGNLVFFAAYKNHIGFYATPNGNKLFKKELADYKQGKGSVQFPINKPMPLQLIAQIVLFRMQENIDKAKKIGKYK